MKLWLEQDIDRCVSLDQIEMHLAFRLGLLPVSAFQAKELEDLSDLIILAA